MSLAAWLADHPDVVFAVVAIGGGVITAALTYTRTRTQSRRADCRR